MDSDLTDMSNPDDPEYVQNIESEPSKGSLSPALSRSQHAKARNHAKNQSRNKCAKGRNQGKQSREDMIEQHTQEKQNAVSKDKHIAQKVVKE